MSSIRIVARTQSWRNGAVILPIVAVAITLLATSGAVFAANANPLQVFFEIFIEPFRSRYSFLETLVSATPLFLTGTAVALAFRSGYYNIGAEGQLLVGAICAAGIGPRLGGVPQIFGILAMVLAGAFGGLVWALIPGLLRTRANIDEVVTTLLLNPTATLLVAGLLNGPWRNPVTHFNESERIAAAAEFPILLSRSRINFGFVVAVIVMIIVALVVHRSALGLKMRAAGLSPDGARFNGLAVEGLLLKAALGSGAIAGITGACLVGGIQFRLTEGISGGLGYTGILVATLGGLNILGVAAAAFLLALVNVGASSANRVFGVPAQLSAVISGSLMMITVAVMLFRRYRLVYRRAE